MAAKLRCRRRVYHFFNHPRLKQLVTLAVTMDLALAFFEKPTYDFLLMPVWVRPPSVGSAAPLVALR